MSGALTFRERVAASRRLAILRLLAEAPTYEASQTLLYQALDDQALGASDDQVHDDLLRLAELELVATTDVAGVILAKITKRGIDVAQGRARAAGVARPRPGE